MAAPACSGRGPVVPSSPDVVDHDLVSESISLDQGYNDFARIEEEFLEFLDESLDPRGPDSRYDILAEFAPPPGGFAVDVGCGEGRNALALARRFGLRVLGVDPVERHIGLATAAAAEAGLSETVRFERAVAEALPVPDASADVVWSNEALTYFDLDRAFAEFARALAPPGIGYVHQALVGPRMTDAEARDRIADGAAVLRPADVEAAITSAGLILRRRMDFGSEWGEYGQEMTGASGRRLLHAARLLRDPDRYIRRFGEANYRIMLADAHWHVYRMIGKLVGVAFVFGHPLQ